MADTPRTLAALQALFPDNSSGDVSPQDLRDFLVSSLGEYGEIYVHDGAAAQSFTTTPSKMTGFTTDGPAAGVTVAAASDKITLNRAGKYLVTFQISFSGGANETFEFHARLAGAEQVQGACIRKLGAGGDVGSASFSCIVTSTGSQDLEIYGESGNAGGANATPVHAQLTVYRVE